MGHRAYYLRLFLALIPGLFLAEGAEVQAQIEKTMFPNDAQELYLLARDAWAPVELAAYGIEPVETVNNPEVRLRLACVLLEAALELDPAYQDARLDYLMLLMSDTIADAGRAGEAIVTYSSARPQDSVPVAQWLRFRFNQFNDRQRREDYLRQQIPGLRSYPVLFSESYTQLGILLLETARADEARSAFQMAIRASNYNDDAYGQLLALLTQPPQSDDPEQQEKMENAFWQNMEIQHILRWRMRLRNNPFDAQAAMNLITLLEQAGRSDLTESYYLHVLDILRRDPGTKPQQYDYTLKRLSALYHARRYQEALTASSAALKEWPDDLPLMAMRILALNQSGQTEQGQLLHARCEQLINQELERNDPPSLPEEWITRTWYYAFVVPDAQKTLHMAQIAVESAQDGPQAARAQGLLAWAYLLNDQAGEAQNIVNTFSGNEVDPLTSLVRARLLHTQGKNQEAAVLLQAVKSIPAPGVQDAIDIYLQQWALEKAAADEQEMPADSNSPANTDALLTALNASFSGEDLNFIHKPQDYLTLSLRFDTDIFSFADPIAVTLYLTNVSESFREPMALGPNQAVDPLVLLQAAVEMLPAGAGDLKSQRNAKMPEKMQPLTVRYLLQQRLLKQGRSNQSLDMVNIGFIRRAMQYNPQQACRITLQAFLEPLRDETGKWTARIESLQPAPVTFIRQAYNPTARRMAAAFKRIRSGSADERIETTRLFTGLIAEASLAGAGRLNYQPQPVDAQECFRAIVDNLTDPDPRVRAWSAMALRDLPLSKQPRALQRLGDLLTDEHWFVRFMAIYALQGKTDLSEYYQWSLTSETHPVVKRLVGVLTGQPLDVIDLPMPPLAAPGENDTGVALPEQPAPANL